MKSYFWINFQDCTKGGSHTRLPSVGFWSWYQFLTVSLQLITRLPSHPYWSTDRVSAHQCNLLRWAVLSISAATMNSEAEVPCPSYGSTCPWCQLHITALNCRQLTDFHSLKCDKMHEANTIYKRPNINITQLAHTAKYRMTFYECIVNTIGRWLGYPSDNWRCQKLSKRAQRRPQRQHQTPCRRRTQLHNECD